MIKLMQILCAIAGVTLAGLGSVMAMTNPGQGDYEKYATEELTSYIKQSVCTKIEGNLKEAASSGCKTLVDTGRPHLEYIIAQTTTRQNFLIFSIYETDLALNSASALPSYQFGTVGVLQKFYTYEAAQYRSR
jgi:uncharacterized protein YceK